MTDISYDSPLLAVSFGTWCQPKRLLTRENTVYCELNRVDQLSSRFGRFQKPLQGAHSGRRSERIVGVVTL